MRDPDPPTPPVSEMAPKMTTIRDSGAVTVWTSNFGEVCLSIPTDDGQLAEVHLTREKARHLRDAIDKAIGEATGTVRKTIWTALREEVALCVRNFFSPLRGWRR